MAKSINLLSYTITGTITNLQNEPVEGLVIRAFYRTLNKEANQLGKDEITNADGRYAISFAQKELLPQGLEGQPYAIFIRVYAGVKLLAESKPAKKIIKNTVINLQVEIEAEVIDHSNIRRVYGMVRNEYGDPLNGVSVQAFDRDIRSEQWLGSSKTKQGFYEIQYNKTQFRKTDKEKADLVLKVLDAAGKELHKTSIQHNAPDEVEININLSGSEYKGQSEFEELTEVLTPLLDGMSPLEIREDEQCHDITFLSGETGKSTTIIGTWVMSHRLSAKAAQEKTPVEASIIFGFLRQGQPGLFYDSLLQDIKYPERVALLEEKLMRKLTSIKPEVQSTLFEKAVKENLIPARTKTKWNETQGMLRKINLRFSAQKILGAGKGTIGQLIDLTQVSAKKKENFIAAFADHEGSINNFWQKLEKDKVLSAKGIKDVKLTFELGGLTRNHIPLVNELNAMFTKGEIKAKRDLAKLSREEWKGIFKRKQADGKVIGIPINIDGENEEEKMEQYAVILEQRFERKYPTTAFAANLSRTQQIPLSAKTDIVHFLENNPEFHLDRYRFDHFIAEKKNALTGIEDKETMSREIKRAQRIFKLSPTFKVVDTLLQHKIDSAQKIYFMGASQFVSEMSKAGINKIEAKSLYAKSEKAYAMALSLFTMFNQSVNGAMPASIPPNQPGSEAQNKIKQIPNLQTLFGSMDYCECSHCRSVYSPAAYFVDLLQFLGQRKMVNDITIKDILLKRRPDLGEIELSCENTNTPMPYIDLVNEILEGIVGGFPEIVLTFNEDKLKPGKIDNKVLSELNLLLKLPLNEDAIVYPLYEYSQSLMWIIRDKNQACKISKDGEILHYRGLTHQTFMNSSELRANSEYMNEYAYVRLGEEVFPLNLPFNLRSFQAKTYFAHLGISQTVFLELFQKSNGVSDYLKDLSRLNITEKEGKILYAPDKGVWEYWGLQQTDNKIPDPIDPTQELSGTWVELLSMVNVLLHRSGLSYRELLHLLDTKFVNPYGALYIRQDAPQGTDFDITKAVPQSCDVSLYYIEHTNRDELPTAFYRMNRFIRLWRKLGCEMWELDMLLPINDPNHPEKEISVGALRWISQMSRLREQFNLEWRVIYSFYNNIEHGVYFDRNKEGSPAIQTLYQRLFLNKSVDQESTFPDDPVSITGSIMVHAEKILAAFQIKESDLILIIKDIYPEQSNVPDLNWNNLSQIYRITVLAKALGLTIDSFLRFKRLWLADKGKKDPFYAPSSTLEFVKLVQKVKGAPFSITELDYLLANQYSVNSGVALEDKAIFNIIKSLREGLQQINDSLTQKQEETTEAYIKGKLGMLSTLRKDEDQVVALSIIDNTIKGKNDDEVKNLIAKYFYPLFPDIASAQSKLSVIPGSADPQTIKDRYKYVKIELEANLIKTPKEDFIRQKNSEVFQIDLPTASELLNRLKINGKILIDCLNEDKLLIKEGDNYQYEINEENFDDIYSSFRLIHKNTLLISKIKTNAVELGWLLSDPNYIQEMEWPDMQSFPLHENEATIPITHWEHIHDFFEWKKNLPKSDVTAFEFLAQVFLPEEKKSAVDVMDCLARLTAWDQSEIDALLTAFQWNAKQDLKKSERLLRLHNCMQTLRRLGVKAERVWSWAKATPTLADAESLKQTVKAKYDLKQWLEVIQPMQDVFREQKRDALVSWLVAHPDKSRNQYWTDVNGLYGHFLIDVEMSPCMLTSRIKQAIASVQLFVQRCLLNLEPEVIIDAETDSVWNQWDWMKNYRVWEANRKVFLYPENWIEPELRDEKSPFFKELENELMQTDINRDSVEEAFRNYLEKLDKVANLEIRAMHNEYINNDKSNLHVFGRTRSSKAPEYFYRKFINSVRWTPWERIDLEINADHLVPTVNNNRLYLFWPQFLEKAEEPKTVNIPDADEKSAKIESPNRFWEIRLFWSELKNGRWTPKVLTDDYSIIGFSMTNGNNLLNISFRSEFPNDMIRIRVYRSINPSTIAPIEHASFRKIGTQIDCHHTMPHELHNYIFSSPNNLYYGNLLKVDRGYSLDFYFRLDMQEGECDLDHDYNSESMTLLQQLSSDKNFIVIDSSATNFPLQKSLFYWDNSRTYFAEYKPNRVSYVFTFLIHYHPFVDLFIKEINKLGVKGLLNRGIQVNPKMIQGNSSAYNFEDYKPTNYVLKVDPDTKESIYPIENNDFSYTGSYSTYNWEIFFHIPFFIANKLSSNQRFEESLEWFHYIFDPTINTSKDPITDELISVPQKYWITKPFYETIDYVKQRIDEMMLLIADDSIVINDKQENGTQEKTKEREELIQQINEWRDNPFKPHLIARMRTVAYQKNVLIKYIQTLIAWGDQLFRRDTIETLNEATQLYILAATILGPRPKNIPKKVTNPIKNYYQLENEVIDPFGNVLEQIENLVPSVNAQGSSGYAYDSYSLPVDPGSSGNTTPPLPLLNLYFSIPHNEKLLTLWDSVADRLFKIRHCMNIEGVFRQLPLFEPPIDPSLLVKAAAAGLDIGSVINDINAPMPLYRFNFMIQRALELCNEVRSLGNAFLSALEKKDAEAFALLRSNNEISMMDYVRILKEKQVNEALTSKESLEKLKLMVEERKQYYTKLTALPVLAVKEDGSSITIPSIPLNSREQISLTLSKLSLAMDAAIALGYIMSGGLKLIPSFVAGAAGFGGSPEVSASMGGQTIGNSAEMAARTLQSIATAFDKGASIVSTLASYERRYEEWDFQKRLAEKEIPQIEKQIVAADIRHQIALQDLLNHDKQKDNLEKEYEYMRNKFTNLELYDWMINQLSSIYFQSYQLAYDIAKRAERCFRYELGFSDSNYIQFGYWDSLKKGLLSGDKLYYDLKRLETTYYEQNRREYELTKHISLAQIDPVALLKLKQNGECIVVIPETLFDMDYPGHYFRRIKTVSLSIPCVAGPYTTIACTLTLISNSLRKDASLLGTQYERDFNNEDLRFRDEIAAIQSIATSSGLNDSGMFEMNFRDERYLPFEGAGAISTWQIKLNKDFKQFDFSTISDVIIHMNYTAREGGELLKGSVVQGFNNKMNDMAMAEDKKGLFRVYDLKREFPNNWNKAFSAGNQNAEQGLVLESLQEKLPYFTRSFSKKMASIVEIVALINKAQSSSPESNYQVQLSSLSLSLEGKWIETPFPEFADPKKPVTMTLDDIFKGMFHVKKEFDSPVELKNWALKINDMTADDSIDELFLIVHYSIQ